MAADLKAQMLLRGYRRKSFTLTLPDTPSSFERELERMYLRAVRATWSAQAIQEIIEQYETTLTEMEQVTDSPQTVQQTLERVNRTTVAAVLRFSQDYRGWASRLTQLHFRRFISKLKYATNVDLSTQIGLGNNEMTIAALLERNVNLVTDISNQAKQRISEAVFGGMQARRPVAEVAAEIRKATGMAADRARRVASDQTVKLSSALDDERLRQVGSEGYEWQHSHKVNFRPEHRDRDGDFIPFGSEIDKEDPPGFAPFCGCKRRMRIDF